MDQILTPDVAFFIILSLVIALVYVTYCGSKWYNSFWELAVKVKEMEKKAKEPRKELVAADFDGKIVYMWILRYPDGTSRALAGNKDCVYFFYDDVPNNLWKIGSLAAPKM